MQYSVLIPLHFTRGLAARCVHAWTSEQRYPSDRYELLLAARHDDTAELAALRTMLRPHDRVLSIDAAHDITLVAEAARAASGDVLVFTEAHCVPEPDFLEACDRAFAEHPAWHGFSGGSTPLAHNRLSEVEAAMYVADIERNLLHHPWLKVLDQCFVIERKAYEASGGLDGRFGHFAEHLLAARLHRAKAVIGFDRRAAIRHHYSGDIPELIEFARDFGHGELLFASEAITDPCGDLFAPPALWRARFAEDRAVARRMVRMLAADLPAALRRRQPWLGGMARWGRAAALPAPLRLRQGVLDLAGRSVRLRFWLKARNRRRSTAAFRALNDAAARQGARQALQEIDAPRFRGNPNLSEWTAATADLVPCVGFHDLERDDRQPFRWTEPAAMVAIDRLSAGDRIVIEWAPLDGVDRNAVRLYLNERRVAPSRVAGTDRTTLITVDRDLEPARLGLSIGRTRGPGDARPLGLPVSRIAWGPVARQPVDLGALRRPRSSAVDGADPIYVLHVQKCAGTSLRAVLGNGFAAGERLSPTHAVYYARQLDDDPELLDRPVAFAVGHFGMDLPAKTPDRRWRVMTVLREPVDHLRSLHGYLVEQRYLPPSSTFAGWVEDDLRLRDTLTGHLCVGTLDAPERGLAAVSRSVERLEAEAVAALQRCDTVGVFERMEDSVDLLCAATGALPPLRAPRLNPTQSPTTSTFDVHAARRLLQVETRLHRMATATCDRQLAELQASLGTADVRAALRRRWFDRAAEQLRGEDVARGFGWLPGDPFAGENLHPLEEHRGCSLRWTGPGERTLVYVPIDTGRRWRLRLALHRASPADHVAAASIRVNGVDVDVERAAAGALGPINDGGTVLQSTFDAPAPDPSSAPFSLLELRSPVRRGEGEFRCLGLALSAILLEPLD